jgi:hypothetical protein
MPTELLLIVNLVFSALAASAAVFAALRIGALGKTLQPPPRKSEGEGRSGFGIQELTARIDDVANQSQTISRQLDGINQQLNELLSSDALHPAPAPPQSAASPPSPPAPEPVEPTPSAPPAPLGDEAPASVPPFAPMAEEVPSAGQEPQRVMPVDPAPPSAPEPQSQAAADPPPAAPPSATDIARELVTGYQATIAERSKGPIREWLTQNNSITLDINEDGQLIPSDGGQIAAIMVDQRQAILLPTAGFVVDFATRFAGSQISMRQVMRGCFDAVVDNSGEMRLQAPAIASRDGDRWVLEKPGRLSGFTDAS